MLDKSTDGLTISTLVCGGNSSTFFARILIIFFPLFKVFEISQKIWYVIYMVSPRCILDRIWILFCIFTEFFYPITILIKYNFIFLMNQKSNQNILLKYSLDFYGIFSQDTSAVAYHILISLAIYVLQNEFANSI